MQNIDYERAVAVMDMVDPFETPAFRSLAQHQRDQLHAAFDPWVTGLRQMAVGIRAHVEDGGQAGTHAYDLIAATEVERALDTETLIHMVAATVLHKLIDEEGGGRSNISFAPSDMDDMHKRYEMKVERDGMTTKIGLTPRKEFAESLTRSVEPVGAAQVPVLPHRPAPPIEPHWFARIDGERRLAADQRSAEEAVRESLDRDDGVVAHVENRRCPKAGCPAAAHINQCLATFCPNSATK